MTGVSKGTISKIENGETKRPDFKMIHALASAYNIPFSNIVELYLSVEKRADILRLSTTPYCLPAHLFITSLFNLADIRFPG
ncbi:helix-turn-helix domain-containing protein [Paenibacillus apiarius]|uniref:helix-turn-helix domain-containing protein n=1 Tax=Paenibacillus apiarius TaxID=46240 RepID=UPI003B3BE280